MTTVGLPGTGQVAHQSQAAWLDVRGGLLHPTFEWPMQVIRLSSPELQFSSAKPSS
jgi:hypothetical protein